MNKLSSRAILVIAIVGTAIATAAAVSAQGQGVITTVNCTRWEPPSEVLFAHRMGGSQGQSDGASMPILLGIRQATLYRRSIVFSARTVDGETHE